MAAHFDRSPAKLRHTRTKESAESGKDSQVVLASSETYFDEVPSQIPPAPIPLDGEPEDPEPQLTDLAPGLSDNDSWLLTPGSPGGAHRDELLLEGLNRAANTDASFDAEPIDWRGFDPELAYETTPTFTLRDDLHALLPNLWRDTQSLFSWRNAVIMGVTTGVALGLRENADGEVRAWTAEFPERWGQGTQVLRDFGEYSYQVPALIGGYAWSLWSQNAEFHQFMTSTISSYTLTSIATVAIKGITDTSRPSDQFEDGRYGFPSFHAASSFTIATNIETYYGWKAGLPAYALAGLVGWSRIDQREHDLSDVVFGSILGYTIGKSVALARQDRARNWQVDPWYDPNQRAGGVSFDLRY